MLGPSGQEQEPEQRPHLGHTTLPGPDAHPCCLLQQERAYVPAGQRPGLPVPDTVEEADGEVLIAQDGQRREPTVIDHPPPILRKQRIARRRPLLQDDAQLPQMVEQRRHAPGRPHPSPTGRPPMLEELLQHGNIEIRRLDVVRRHPAPERADVLEKPTHGQRRVAPRQQLRSIRLDERAHPTRSSPRACHVRSPPCRGHTPRPGQAQAAANYPDNRDTPPPTRLTPATPGRDSRGVGIGRSMPTSA